jgi:hypothetical protein
MSITDKNKLIPPNKGELKQKIKLKSFIEKTKRGTCVELTELYPILDVAAKEFPFRDDALGISTRKIRKGGKLNLEKDLRTPTIEDARTWFLKFFGDATP